MVQGDTLYKSLQKRSNKSYNSFYPAGSPVSARRLGAVSRRKLISACHKPSLSLLAGPVSANSAKRNSGVTVMCRQTRQMAALPAHNPPDHQLDDAEKILRVFGEWQQGWDEAANNAIQCVDFASQVQFAIQCHADGMSELKVRWALIERFGKGCRIGQVEAAVDRALAAPRKLSREAQLTKVGLQRAKAIQGALASGEWAAAMRGIDREGDRLGELNAESGLGPDDLRLVVEIEGDGEGLPLEPGDGEPIQAQAEHPETAETGEIEA